MITDPQGQELMKQLDEIASRLQSKEISPEQADAEATLAMAAHQQGVIARVETSMAERRKEQRRRSAIVFALIIVGLFASGTLLPIFRP